ncbi:MAG: hypothetical protein CMH26_09380 [Micavibrio sp.]|nr:hypothetical protein [Micavibrio sp.]
MLENIEIIGLIAGFLTAFSTVPQSIKIIKEKDSSNVSTAMLIMLTASYGLWLFYGFYLQLISIIIWNVIAFAFGVTILTLKFIVWPTKKNNSQKTNQNASSRPAPAE